MNPPQPLFFDVLPTDSGQNENGQNRPEYTTFVNTLFDYCNNSLNQSVIGITDETEIKAQHDSSNSEICVILQICRTIKI
jgi:hypothetical protein